ncbi:MAG: transporter [Gemmataceae bacterium]|nr:transporter [Gemmataceae bacterium]
MGNEDAVKPDAGAEVPATHPKGFLFLFAGEFAERFSFYGMRAILPLYLSDQMGFGEVGSGTYYPLFLGLCYFLPLLGGYIADNFLGKYWTIVGFSVPYVAGQFLVGFENKYLLVLSLGLLAMGTGVIKPNISTLLGMTYDQQRPGQDKLRSNAFQYFYMSINIGAFLSTLIVPFVRTETGSYLYAFMVPAVFMVIALGIFAAGKPYYAVEVINRHRPPMTPEEKAERWQVLGRIGLLFLLVTFFWGVFDQSSYTWVFFAKTYMDRRVFGYELAPDSIQALNPLFIVLFIGGTLVYRTVTATGRAGDATGGVRPTSKMLVGFLLTAACMGVMAVAGFLAGSKQDTVRVALKEGDIILPPADTKLSDVSPAGGKVELSFPGSVRLTVSDWVYDPDKKRGLLSDGELEFGDGKKLVIKGGRIDFDQSRGVFGTGPVSLVGVLETRLKPGDYPLGRDKLTIGKENTAAVKVGETVAAPKDEKPTKVWLESMEWVRPEERVTVWWMALAFLVITVAEILISVTGLELAFVVAPQNMKGFVTGCWLLTVAIANWFINAPIAGLYPAMHPGMYFLMLAGVGLLVAALFVPVSARFNATGQTASPTRAPGARPGSQEGNTEVV